MAKRPPSKGNFGALLRVARTARSPDAANTAHARRQEIAEFCRFIGGRLNEESSTARPSLPEGLKLSPRTRQTLQLLLAGDSEKQIANKLSLSPHTVHVYVKALYRGFDVCSRGELLARFVQLPNAITPAANPRSGDAHKSVR